jgi:hypothetical protein
MTDSATEQKIDFDTPAQKGWASFTKFLTVNLVVIIAVLLLIGALTVWS